MNQAPNDKKDIEPALLKLAGETGYRRGFLGLHRSFWRGQRTGLHKV